MVSERDAALVLSETAAPSTRCGTPRRCAGRWPHGRPLAAALAMPSRASRRLAELRRGVEREPIHLGLRRQLRTAPRSRLSADALA